MKKKITDWQRAEAFAKRFAADCHDTSKCCKTDIEVDAQVAFYAGIRIGKRLARESEKRKNVPKKHS